MRKGFTLVEIMIVVAIIALLAAIAIPNLLRARISAQEATAAAAMHTIITAQTQWRASHTTYANLSALDDETPPYVDSTLASGTKQGYSFGTPVNNASNVVATAVPQTVSQARSYYIDEGGVLCRSTATGATAETAHVAAGSTCPAAYTEMQ